MLKMINETFWPFFRWILWGVWDERVTPILIILGLSVVGIVMYFALSNKK